MGGVAKIVIRNAIAQRQSFLNAEDCVNFLSSKFGKCDAPSYSLHLIETESIEKERESARFRRFPTVKGSSSFQVIVFEPDSNLIKVAPFLCGCDKCLTSQYGSCENFVECPPQTGELNHILMHHQLQEL